MGFPIWTALLDTSPWGMMNTQWNLGLESMRYRWSCFSNPFSANMDYLLDPRFALFKTQQQFQNNYNGWGGKFDSNNWFMNGTYLGGLNAPYNGWGNNTWGNNGGNGGGGSTVTGGGSKEAERLQSYTKVFDKLIKNKVLSEAQIKAYNEAKKKSTAAEKLEAVQTLFKEISASNIISAVLDDDTIKSELKKAGFYYSQDTEDESVELDDATVGQLNSLITDTDGGAFTSIASCCKTGGHIIEVLSHWNEAHNKDSDRCIIRYVANNLKNGNYSTGIANFVTSLTTAADAFKNSPETMKKKAALEKIYTDKVQKAAEEYDKTKSANAKINLKNSLIEMAPAFEALYAQIRMQQAAKFDGEINEKYGKEFNSVVENLIPEKLIQDATKKDLQHEGISSVPEAEAVQKKSRYSSEEELQQHEYETVEERVEALAGTITETEKSKNGTYGEDVHVYQSKGKDEDGHRQYFIIKDDELVRLKGWLDGNKQLHLSDGTTVAFDEITEEHYETVEDSDILTTDKKAEKEQKAKEQKEATKKETLDNIKTLTDAGVLKSKGNGRYYSETYKSEYKIDENGKLYNITKKRVANVEVMLKAADKAIEDKKSFAEKQIAEQDGAFDLGYQAAQDLIGYTNDDELKDVEASLKVLSKDTVIGFLQGYYSNDRGGNGLFLQLALETTKLKNSVVVPVMRAIVDAVPEENRNTKQFKYIQRICRMYERKDGDKDFKMSNHDWGWGWNRIWGIDDLDQFDDAVEALFNLTEDPDNIQECNANTDNSSSSSES